MIYFTIFCPNTILYYLSYIGLYIHIQSPNVSKIGALQPFFGDGDQETVQITSNGWRAGITLDNFVGGRAGGRRSLVIRGLSVILTLQPQFLDRV